MKSYIRVRSNYTAFRVVPPFKIENDFESEVFAIRIEDAIHKAVDKMQEDLKRVRKGKHVKK